MYHVDRNTDWYDFLAKRSQFGEIIPIWRGTRESNAVTISIANSSVDTAKQQRKARELPITCFLKANHPAATA